MKLKTGLMVGGLAIALPLMFGVYQVWPRSTKSDWQPAEAIAPDELMAQAAEENLGPSFDGQLGQLKVMKIVQSGQVAPLYLINSRIPSLPIHENPLCGALGCLFLGYVQTSTGYQNVLSTYFDLRLPPDIALLEVGDELQNEMPELIIHQVEGNQLLQLRMALNHERYEVIDTQYLPLPNE
ncbi:MAG: hypothetical protein AAFY72_06425 [Cyanobacteria bacterium J06649_4]